MEANPLATLKPSDPAIVEDIRREQVARGDGALDEDEQVTDLFHTHQGH